MCQFEVLLSTDFNDENKYNTKQIDGREECWMLFFLCINRISYWSSVSKSYAKTVMEIELCMCG